jgi:alpha-galactosidase
MLANRTSDGLQIANPAKFPDGFKAVADYIHSLGLKSGLYTAKGTHTCARFAASCDHEVQDAAQWASWGIDYVKDDSCSSCDNKTDNQLYGGMWQAIQASNRAMVLTVEGNPDDALITKGGYGNAKRVGPSHAPSANRKPPSRRASPPSTDSLVLRTLIPFWV